MEPKPLALVFGASRGLGLLVARELLKRNHTVAIAARDAAELEAAVHLLAPFGDVTSHVCDVRDRQGVARLVAELERRHRGVDVAVTVAGVIQVGPAEAMEIDHFRTAIDTMLWGPIHVAHAVLPGMRKRGQGRIGTVASVGGVVAPPHLLPYSAAKFGAVGFSDGLAAELTGSGVTATTIVPGLMRTGSHERAEFTGNAAREYAWFAPAASLPLLSMNAERAASRIVDGVLEGRPLVTLTPLTWMAMRVRGLAPATTTRAMGVASRLLPSSPDHPTETVSGRVAAQRLRTPVAPVVKVLSTLGTRAARRYNERPTAR